jgi:hypothetical protein
MSGRAREYWPQLHIVEVSGIEEKPRRMISFVAARITPGSIPVASVEGFYAGATIDWVLVVAPGTLPEEVAVVLGPEVISERRHFFAAILKIHPDSLNRAENEDEGAHDRQNNR